MRNPYSHQRLYPFNVVGKKLVFRPGVLFLAQDELGKVEVTDRNTARWTENGVLIEVPFRG